MSSSTDQNVSVNISSLTLLKVVVIVGAIFFFWFIRDILMIMFVSLILASAFDPWVDHLQKRRVPRSVAILSIYLGILVCMAGIIYLLIPPLVIEINQLALSFPAYWNTLFGYWQQFQSAGSNQFILGQIENTLGDWQSGLGSATGGVVNTVTAFFGGIFSVLLVMVITFYLTIEEQALKRLVRSFIPVKNQPYVTHLINRMQEKIGWWLRGQLLLSFIIFAITYISLTVFGVKYALVLALFAGLTELVPYVGPFIGLIPAAFIALTQSPGLMLIVIGIYVVIQQLENYVIVPQVMQRTVGLNPIVVIVAMLIGAKLAGIIGIVLAVPVTTALSVLLGDVLEGTSDQLMTDDQS